CRPEADSGDPVPTAFVHSLVATLPVSYQAGTGGPALTKTSERLFTGISTSSSSSSPRWGVRDVDDLVGEAAPHGLELLELEGAVEDKDPVRPQEAPRTGEEPECRLPGRNVDHI